MTIATMRNAAVIALALGAAAPALADDSLNMPLGIWWNGDKPAGDPQYVNLLFRPGVDANTVEMQVTAGGKGDCLVDSTSGCEVQGLGDLNGRENIKALWLSVDANLDLSKLDVHWKDGAGLKPTDVYVGANMFRAGASGCKFDILIEWLAQEKLGQVVEYSTLEFAYHGSGTLSPSSFDLEGQGCKNGKPFKAVGHIQNIYGPQGSGWIKDGGGTRSPAANGSGGGGGEEIGWCGKPISQCPGT